MTTSPLSDTGAAARAEVNALRALADDVAASLRSQQELLKLRNITLMPELITQLALVEHDLARLEQVLEDEHTELEQLNALVQTSAMVNSSLDVDTILSQAMDEILNLTRAGRGYILLSDEETGDLEFRIARDIEPDSTESDDGEEIHVSRTILNQVLETGRPLLTDNAQTDPRLVGSDTIARFVLRSVMCAPLMYRDHLIGAIYVDNRFREGVFTERELNLLTAFCNQTAVAIENAILFARVQTALAEITQIKELIENVFASITSGIITTNADDVITTFNNAASAILARPLDEAVGHPLDVILPRVSIETFLTHVRENGETLATETQPDIPNRGRIALAMRVSPLKNATQEIQGAAVVIDDLTEQRERDEMLNLMTRYLPPGMVENIQQIADLGLGGERRDVTCAFIDVIPYRALAAEVRPQQVMTMLNVYLEVATQVINEAQGIIDKYMGSEVMVLFNTQLNPNRSHAAAAVQMALILRDAFVELYQRLEIAPQPHLYRVGIHSGVATLGNVGSLNRRSFTAIGDTINTSKRLEENAVGGQILISQQTYELIGTLPGVQFIPRDPFQVKGKSQPVMSYEVFRQ